MDHSVGDYLKSMAVRRASATLGYHSMLITKQKLELGMNYTL